MIYINAYGLNKIKLYAGEIPLFLPDCPFGNLQQKYQFVLTKLHLLNENIEEILSLDQKIRDRHKHREFVDIELSYKPIALKMTLCSNLKIYTDELISICYLVNEKKRTGEWPIELKKDSIATVLDFNNGFEEFKGTKEFLEKLNGLGNAVKHSFINTETLWYRSYEPTSKIIGFYNHYNKIKANEIVPFEVELLEFIDEFNNFLNITKNKLKISCR